MVLPSRLVPTGAQASLVLSLLDSASASSLSGSASWSSSASWSAWSEPAAVTSCSYTTYVITPTTCAKPVAPTTSVPAVKTPDATKPSVATYTGGAAKVAGFGAAGLAGLAFLL